jgi:hypothetical protein
MRARLRSVGIVIALAGSAACVWAQAPSSHAERAPRSRPSASVSRPQTWPGASAWTLPSGLPSVRPTPSSRAGRSMSELAEAVRRGGVRPEEIRARLSELTTTRAARRDARLAELHARHGTATLNDPAVREEMRVHARRMALLHRAQIVAASDLAEPKRSQTLARISALTAKEERRHDSRLVALRSRVPKLAGAAASASAGLSGNPADVAAPKASAR